MQEFPDLAWRSVCAIFRNRNRRAGAVRDSTARGTAGIAGLYEREGHRWEEFLAHYGIDPPRRGPTARSRFHGIAKYLLGLGVGGDVDGTATVLAAVLDEWLEHRDTIQAEQIPALIAGTKGGARAIYERRKESVQTSSPVGGKRYWLTPTEWMAELNARYHFDFDPCPNPRPPEFDGLTVEWGARNWCNPPFEDSFAPWIRKAWEECRLGKLTVMVIPIYKNGDIARLDVAGAEITYAGIPDWLAIEDGTSSPLPPQQRQPCVLAVFRPQAQVAESALFTDQREAAD
jgi:hypothetical protein